MSQPVVVNEAFLAGLMNNPIATKEFAFLKVSSSTKSCCGGSRPKPANYNAIKSAIAGLPADRQRRLLELAGVSSIRLIYRSRTGLADKVIG